VEANISAHMKAAVCSKAEAGKVLEIRDLDQPRFATMPVTSRQLNFCCLTFRAIRCNAPCILTAPIAPKNVALTSSTKKKKCQRTARILSSRVRAVQPSPRSNS
jgi:hypothetical protein